MSTGSSQIRVLAVDDHALVRDGIAGLVGVQPDMVVVGEASTGREAIQQFRMLHPDVTLMDLQICCPDSVSARAPSWGAGPPSDRCSRRTRIFTDL